MVTMNDENTLPGTGDGTPAPEAADNRLMAHLNAVEQLGSKAGDTGSKAQEAGASDSELPAGDAALDGSAPDEAGAVFAGEEPQAAGSSEEAGAGGATAASGAAGEGSQAKPDAASGDGAGEEELGGYKEDESGFTETFEPEFDLPGNNSSIPIERVRKSKRTKAALIAVIVVLVLVIGGLVYLGYFLLTNQSADVPSISESAPAKLGDGNIDDNRTSSGQAAVRADIPNLKELFGLSLDAVKDKLPSEFTLTKSEAATDAVNADIAKLATFTYTVRGTGAAGQGSASVAGGTAPNATAMVENLYLSLDANDKVIEVYYVASLDLLGYDAQSFEELVSQQKAVTDVLGAAGVAASPEWRFAAPKAEDYTQYVDPEAKEKKLKKETFSFYAGTSQDTAPKNWNLTFTYDYGASGVAVGTDVQPTQRMLYLKLY